MPPPSRAYRQTFGPLIAHTARQWRRCLDQRLQPFGLTQASWLPLLYLSRAGKPLAQKDLAHILNLDVSTLVRQLDALQSEGLIERRAARDRRVKELHLTASGQATVARVEGVARTVRAKALAGVKDADLAVAHRVLAQVRTALGDLGREQPVD